jgi:hypothetical protein
MKKTALTVPLRGCLLLAAAQLLLGAGVLAQGTVEFNSVPSPFTGHDYYEGGMWFRVAPRGAGDYMSWVDGGHYAQAPYNGTPYMAFSSSYLNYVVFSLTNGYTFGLTSADLADPQSYSHTQQITISFTGVRADNSVVTATFTTPIGGTTNFTTFQFGSDFTSGLTRVEIPSSVWAMDNVVFGNVVPEPSSSGLVLLALLVVGAREAYRRRRATTTATWRA